MSERDPELARQLAELTRSLETLQRELEPSGGRPAPPSPRQLVRFTSEVTIPALVLVLETNVRALKLVQRALRMAEGRAETGESETRARAVELGQATLSRLDDTLDDLQGALEGRPPDDEARRLLDQVRDLEDEIEAQLRAGETSGSETSDTEVDIDVDAELQSLKDDVDDDPKGDGGAE